MTTPATGPTRSTNAIVDALRTALLDFEDPDGNSLRDVVGENLYRNRAPDNLSFPYGTLRLNTRRSTNFNPLRKTATFEVQLYGKPASEMEAISTAADRCEQAMNFYVNSSAGQGLIFVNDVQRDELPPGGAVVDSEICTIRLVFTLAIWPAYLTSLTT